MIFLQRACDLVCQMCNWHISAMIFFENQTAVGVLTHAHLHNLIFWNAKFSL